MKVTRLKRVDRRGVAKARQHSGAKFQPVQVDEKESLVAPVVDLRNINRPTDGKTEGIVSLFGGSVGEEPAGVQLVVGKVLVETAMEILRTGLGRVFHRAAARVAVLGGIRRRNHLHL